VQDNEIGDGDDSGLEKACDGVKWGCSHGGEDGWGCCRGTRDGLEEGEKESWIVATLLITFSFRSAYLTDLPHSLDP